MIGLVLFVVIEIVNAEIVWWPEIPISQVDGISSSLSSNNARVIAVGDDGVIHVVWDEERSSYPEVQRGVWYRNSSDAGNTWRNDTCISFPLYYYNILVNYINRAPTIAMIEPTKVNVLWDGFDEFLANEYVFYFYSPDNGRSWEFSMNAKYHSSDPPSGFNSLCSDRTNYLLFYDIQWMPDVYDWHLLGKVSTDGGTSWDNTPTYGDYTTNNKAPCTACDSNDMGYLVWAARATNNLSVIMFGSTAGYHTEVVPYPGSGSRLAPYIESNLAGRLYLVWSDSRDGNSEIYFKKSTDGGSTWSNDQRLTNASGNSTEPALVLGDSGKIYLVWIDTRDGNSEVYFKYSEDDGVTWSADTRLTNNPGSCSHTHIAISPDKGNLYVVWNDTRDRQEEVYFKRGTILTGISELSNIEKRNQFNIVPNPFRVKTKIGWELKEEIARNLNSAIRIKIYEKNGNLVKVFSVLQHNLSNSVIWDGTDDSGRKLPPGVYFVRLETGEYRQTEKVILIK